MVLFSLSTRQGAKYKSRVRIFLLVKRKLGKLELSSQCVQLTCKWRFKKKSLLLYVPLLESNGIPSKCTLSCRFLSAE